jgi:hypothetical protein
LSYCKKKKRRRKKIKERKGKWKHEKKTRVHEGDNEMMTDPKA